MKKLLRRLFGHRHKWVMDPFSPAKRKYYLTKPLTCHEYAVVLRCRCGASCEYTGSEEKCREVMKTMWKYKLASLFEMPEQ